jgi:hypothetical protein
MNLQHERPPAGVGYGVTLAPKQLFEEHRTLKPRPDAPSI